MAKDKNHAHPLVSCPALILLFPLCVVAAKTSK
jgi:hypothetical protein